MLSYPHHCSEVAAPRTPHSANGVIKCHPVTPHLKLGSISHAVRGLQRDGTALARAVDATKARAAPLVLSSADPFGGFVKGSVSPGIADCAGALVRKARKCKGLADVENLFPVNLVS